MSGIGTVKLDGSHAIELTRLRAAATSRQLADHVEEKPRSMPRCLTNLKAQAASG